MPAPEVPNRTDPAFNSKADTFFKWITSTLWDALTMFFDSRLLSTSTVSTTSITIDTATPKTFTVEAGKGYQPGMFIVAANTTSPGNYIVGQVISYNSGTGALSMSNTSRGGSGTLAAWTITQSVVGGGAGLGANTFTGLQKWANGANIASAATVNLSTATGNTVRITGTTATSAFTIDAGTWMQLIAVSAWPLTYNATTCRIVGGQSYTCSAGDQVFVNKDNTGIVYVYVVRANGKPISNPVVRDYFDGFTMSTAGASATMTVGAGQCADSSNSEMLTLLSSLGKTTSAWAVGSGNGGLDTGTIANSTWYHFYAIRRPDTGVVDVVFSTNASSPTLPTNYTQHRYIGSGKTNGSSQWTLFTQIGNTVLWDAAVVSFDAVNPGTAAVLRTVETPLGVKTLAKISCGVGGFTTSNLHAVFSSPDVSDQAPSSGGTAALTGFNSIGAATSSNAWMIAEQDIRTNTSSQIRTRLSASAAADRIGGITRGWTYLR